MGTKFKVGDLAIDSRVTVARILAVNAKFYSFQIEKAKPDVCKVGELYSLDHAYFDGACELVTSKIHSTSEIVWTGIEDIVESSESKFQPILTIRDAFVFEHESKRPKYDGQALEWHKLGKCPRCGELGRYHLSVAICSTHGEY